jgi:prophage DNA circulation protein
MPAAFDDLQRAAFAGFEFPVRDIRVVGGLRDHVHEYPHSPGGAPEKLGRKLYEIHYTAPFLNTFKAYPKLWPETLASLRIIFEGGGTFDLVIPTIGTISAYCVSWEERTDLPSNRSGVIVDLTFREDQDDQFLTRALINTYAASLGSTNDDLINAMLSESFLDGLPANQKSLFAAIQETANSITAIGDQADLYANLVQAKAANLARLCETADATVTKLNDPAHFRVMEALLLVWQGAGRLERDALNLARPLIPYVTPVEMSVTQIAIAIYGDTAQAGILMRTNAFENPFRVPAGTAVTAYALPTT